MKLQGLSHIFLFVTDVERARAFYSDILGLEVLEEDPAHGGLFLALPGGTHIVDMTKVDAPPPSAPELDGSYRPKPGVGHVAFHIGSHEALRDAYFELLDKGVQVFAKADHKSQQSIYFLDPDNNLLEICWEKPNARELYLNGRGDEDEPLEFAPR
ncbi:MAG TPA: VOC family protein [Rhizomicrobium sp.]|nr:VOC family protein [Rhizomicrobium sp.]